MTRATYRQVLLATGLTFCSGPGLGVNPAAATHPITDNPDEMTPPGSD